MTVQELVRELLLAPQDAELQIHGLTEDTRGYTIDIKQYRVDRVEVPTPRTVRLVVRR